MAFIKKFRQVGGISISPVPFFQKDIVTCKYLYSRIIRIFIKN